MTTDVDRAYHDVTGFIRVHTAQGFPKFALTVAFHTGDANDLAGANVEVNSVHGALPAVVLDH